MVIGFTLRARRTFLPSSLRPLRYFPLRHCVEKKLPGGRQDSKRAKKGSVVLHLK
jgi:hypothetical protein